MKKFPHRVLALALCFTLTLGAFAYHPQQAKAVAGVDDAVVIGALLTAFAGGCGLIFSNNGMTSDELASGLSAKWEEYKAMLERTPSNFADWLGYEDMDSLITDLRWDKVKECLEIPRAVARKLTEFTDWLLENTGIVAPVVGDTPASVPSSAPAASVSHSTLIDTGSNFAFSTYTSASASVYCEGYLALEGFSTGSAVALDHDKFTYAAPLVFDVGNGCSIKVWYTYDGYWTFRLIVNSHESAPKLLKYQFSEASSNVMAALAYYNGLPTLVFIDSAGLYQMVDLKTVFPSAYLSYAAAFTPATAGSEEKPVVSSNARSFSTADGSTFTLGGSSLDSTIVPYGSIITFPNGNYIKIGLYSYTRYGVNYDWYGLHFFNEKGEEVSVAGTNSSKVNTWKHCGEFMEFWWSLIRNDDGSLGVCYNWKCMKEDYSYSSPTASCSLADFQEFAGVAPSSADLSISTPAGVQTPDLADEKDTPVGITGVGDGTAATIEELLQKILEQLQANTLAPTIEGVDTDTGGNSGTDTDEDAKPYLPYIPRIFGKIGELPGLIAEKVGELFKPDEALVTEITDTFKGKFGFLPTLKRFGDDLFGMTAETEPPVIWVHLEDAESRYGYVYGDKQKMLDLTWYQKYKASVDGLLSGFLWLGYLWLLFKRAPGILNGMSMEGGLLPPLQTGGDVIDAPRIGSGNPSMHYGDGFTFRDKGGRRK